MMNPTQRGCYFSLWLYAWRSLAIPKDFLLLSLLCGTTADEMEKAWPRIAGFFADHPTDPEKLIHPGHEKERAKQAAFKAVKRIAGSKGGKALKAKRAAGNERGTTTISPLAKGVAKSASSSSSSFSSSDSLSPKPPQGEERESDSIQEPEARILLRAEIGAIFKRPAQRAWSKAELECLDALGEITPAEILLLRRFYAANIEGKKDRRRHNLESLLRNWSGEIDKANGYFAAQQRKDYAL